MNKFSRCRKALLTVHLQVIVPPEHYRIEGLEGALNWAIIMMRDAGLSNSACIFSRAYLQNRLIFVLNNPKHSQCNYIEFLLYL